MRRSEKPIARATPGERLPDFDSFTSEDLIVLAEACAEAAPLFERKIPEKGKLGPALATIEHLGIWFRLVEHKAMTELAARPWHGDHAARTLLRFFGNSRSDGASLN